MNFNLALSANAALLPKDIVELVIWSVCHNFGGQNTKLTPRYVSLYNYRKFKGSLEETTSCPRKPAWPHIEVTASTGTAFKLPLTC
jgi:hypothetical protein